MRNSNVCFITGATGGIGLPLTKKVLEANDICCALVRNAGKLFDMLGRPYSSTLLFSDYALRADDDSLILDNLQLEKAHGKWSLVLNAFDILPIQQISRITLQEAEKNIHFNVQTQVCLILQLVQHAQAKEKELHIVLINSGAAFRPIEGWGMYCAGKAYLTMFLKVLAQESHLPIVLYDPGVVDTGMQAHIRQSTEEDFPAVQQFRTYQSESKLASPDAVAEDIFHRYLQQWTAKEICEKFGG